MPEFKARILKIGINPYIAVPARVSRFFRRTGYVPVTVHFSGGEVRSTLVPVGEGRHRLFINGIMRRLASVDVGDLVAVRLVHDKSPRTQRMPKGLSVALGKLPWARKNWDELETVEAERDFDVSQSCQASGDARPKRRESCRWSRR